MSKTINLADGGSFSRRPSSFLKAPKFKPTQLDIPDIEGLAMFAQQPKTGAARKPLKAKEYDFKIPANVTALTGRKQYYLDQYREILQNYGTRVNRAQRGLEEFPEQEMIAQEIENYWPSVATALKNEKDAFDKVNNDRIEVSDDIFVGKGNSATVRDLDEEGNPTGQLKSISIKEWQDNKDKYTSPLTNQGYSDYQDVYGSRGAFETNPRAKRVYPASMEESLDYLSGVLSPVKGSGSDSIKASTMQQLGADPAAFQANPEAFFETVMAATKTNANNINAAIEVLNNMPENYKKAFTSDWIKKIDQGIYKGERAQFFGALIDNTALTYYNDNKSITDPTSGSSGAGKVGDPLGFYTQVAADNYAAVADSKSHQETFWQSTPDGKVVATKKKVHDLPVSQELRKALLVPEATVQGQSYKTPSYVKGTLVDWRNIDGAKDPGEVTGVKYVRGLDGEPASLYIEKTIYISDEMDSDQLKVYKAKFGYKDKIKSGIEKGLSVGVQLMENVIVATGGDKFKKWDETLMDKQPIIEGEEDEVLKGSWSINNLKSLYQDNSGFRRLSNDEATKRKEQYSMGGNEVYAITVMEPMTVPGIRALGIETAGEDKLVNALTLRENLMRNNQTGRVISSMQNSVEQ